MEDAAREPCPWCREPAAADARVCPHCRRSLTFDLISGGIADPRCRYRIARELARMGRPFPPLPRLQGLLAGGETVIAAGITRAAAARALAVLRENGASSRTELREELENAAPLPQSSSVVSPPRTTGRILLLLPAAFVIGLLLWLLRSSSHPVAAPEPIRRAATLSAVAATPALRDLVARALDSTATVHCPASSGAGFFAAPELLVTNDHVLCAAAAAPEIVLRNGRRLRGQTIWRDDWLDLALVRVPGADARPLPLGDATRVAPGDTVVMIGNPVGMDFTVTRTIVSHQARNVFGLAYVQFDGNVNPGNSGGPLLDAEGRAVGVVSMMVRNARGLGLALPINYLYERSSTDLALPLPPPDFTAWHAVVQTARREDEREIESMRVAFRKPGLSGAALSPDGHVYALVIARGMPAGSTPLSFDLLVGDRVVCHPGAIVEGWDLWARRRGELGGDPRYLRWLDRAGLAGDIYVGTAPLHVEGCPDPATLIGAELVLRDADPVLNRALLRPMRELR
jgi:serine protease Do